VSLDRAQLLGVAYAERQRLGRMIQYAAPDTWDRPSAAAGWWNRDVLAHLAAQDTAAAQLVAGEPAVELDEYRASAGEDGFSLDAFNAWSVARRSGQEVRELIETWGKAAEAFIAYSALLSDEDWADARFPWLAGDIAARYLVQSRIVEWWLHGEDMRATNGLGPQYEHWPIHLTIDLGVRMLPWALARAGYDLEGRSVLVEVEGAGEGRWHWGLGAGEVPGGEKHADATLRGRAPQLALVAGRRLSSDDVQASGAVVPGGDRDLARIVLAQIRAFA
jgi:uncharacterized protein (TIGR03083 family)